MTSLTPRSGLALAAVLFSLAAVSSCGINNVNPAGLPTTLGFQTVDGGRVAMQNGQPVPDFGFQPRPRLDLDTGWRFQPARLDNQLTFEPRSISLKSIEMEAAGRQLPDFDDSLWKPITVPGSVDLPPSGRPVDGWYRVHFNVPETWADQSVTLKFGSVNYLADVWLNGTYLGYHEGGVTPFAFNPGKALAPGEDNVLAIRVYDPPKGTRLDVVPWYFSDWWEYEGITAPVWLEASYPLHVVRADVVPHLDAADISVVLQNDSNLDVSNLALNIEVLPAAVTNANLADPSPLSLVPPDAPTIAAMSIGSITASAHSTLVRDGSFIFAHADNWSVKRPALYVLGIYLTVDGVVIDSFYDTFGLRRIQVDPTAPKILLNGEPIAFTGAAVQNEVVSPPMAAGEPHGGTPLSATDQLTIVRQAQAVNINLLRTNHVPANPYLLTLADRLGIGIWEEIPLNHFTPETFNLVMQRGLPQQMLAEMALRDFNRPSVMFHGFANESTGVDERLSAMTTLRDLDRRIDGTRLTGQAMYGSDPTDPTSAPLDVAGYTFYYGIFYGGPAPEPGTSNALLAAHRTYPHKPVMILEFGDWLPFNGSEAEQRQVFRLTYPAFAANLDSLPAGFIGSTVWWSLEDYWTDVPGIAVERFGLFKPDGGMRAVGAEAKESFGKVTEPSATTPHVVSGGQAVPVPVAEPSHFAGQLAYAAIFPCMLIAVIVAALLALRRLRLARLRTST
ncbi:MAG TPA: sugar-binding domain-containing protein [Candidatus Dormibacteraeota bacterium]